MSIRIYKMEGVLIGKMKDDLVKPLDFSKSNLLSPKVMQFLFKSVEKSNVIRYILNNKSNVNVN